VRLIDNNNLNNLGIDFRGAVVFHTAVSSAGIGPTSSNKKDIESSIIPLSRIGVKIHLRKGSLDKKTVEGLRKYNSVFAITPPCYSFIFIKTIIKGNCSF